jgi:hypothetical protein
MKTITSLLSLVLMLMLYTCSVDESLTPDSAGDDLLKAAQGNVITVNPSGGDDTDELIAAFEEAKTAPGSTVQLLEGTYNIGLIQVDDFYGSFLGAGKGKTIIVPLEGLPCDWWIDNISPGLIKFMRGDIRVAKMSFRNLESQQCIWDFLGFHDWAIDNVQPNHKIRAVVDNVEFTNNNSILMAILCAGDFAFEYDVPYSNADISITNCSFNNFFNAFQNLGIGQGNFVFTNNYVTNVFQTMWLQDNIGGSTLISGNRFYIPEGGYGISINDLVWGLQEYQLSNGCQYEVSGNEFYTDNSWAAIDIYDGRRLNGITDNNNPLLVLIKSNLFDLTGSTSIGINNVCSNDAVIKNNKFTGQAPAGVYSDELADNSLILGNNFSNMINTPYNIVLLGNNNTVVGGNNKGTSVLNLGENNVITGLKLDNEGENPVGPTITDNYRIMQENMKNMRKP